MQHLLKDERLPFGNCTFDCYLPWEDRRVTVAAPTLPPFRRSIDGKASASHGWRKAG